MIQKIWHIILLGLIFGFVIWFIRGTPAHAQDKITNLFPEHPTNYVTDMTGVVSQSDQLKLNSELANIQSTTQGQIAVVVLPTIGDYAPNEVAMTIGRAWGVGVKDDNVNAAVRNNGIVMLVVPKTSSVKGQCFIAPAQHMQGFLTDAAAGEICRNTMIPTFKNGDYAGGIEGGIKAIQEKYVAAAAEVAQSKQPKKEYEVNWWLVTIIGGSVLAIVIFVGLMIERQNKLEREEAAQVEANRLAQQKDYYRQKAYAPVPPPIPPIPFDTQPTVPEDILAASALAAATARRNEEERQRRAQEASDDDYNRRSRDSGGGSSSSGGSDFGGFGGGGGYDGGGGGSSW